MAKNWRRRQQSDSTARGRAAPTPGDGDDSRSEAEATLAVEGESLPGKTSLAHHSATGNTDHERLGRSQWGLLAKILAGIGAAVGALAAALALFVGVPPLFHHADPMQAEEMTLSRLVAGENYARLRQIIGVPADYVVELPSGNELYQYERPWETLQILVNSTGKALSIGIYAKTASFKPRIQAGGGAVIILNTMINTLPLRTYNPNDELNAYCGAHKAGYLEVFDGLPNAFGAESLAIGESDAEAPAMNIGGACSIPQSCASLTPFPDNEISAAYAECVYSSRAGRRYFAKIIPSVLIITAPLQSISPDMLHPPDEVPSLPS